MNFLRLFLSKPISQYHPLLYFMSTRSRRMMRYWQWKTDGKDYAHSFSDVPLAFRVKKHQSVLIRKLGEAISTGNTIKSSISKLPVRVFPEF